MHRRSPNWPAAGFSDTSASISIKMPEVVHWSHKGPQRPGGELASARPSAVSKLTCHSLDPAAPASNGAGALQHRLCPSITSIGTDSRPTSSNGRAFDRVRQINGRIFAKPPHFRERSPPSIIVIWTSRSVGVTLAAGIRRIWVDQLLSE